MNALAPKWFAMANEDILKILMQGVEVWNEWRSRNSEGELDLSGADLSGTDLFGAEFFEANLSGANLRGANLVEAHLSYADLSDANLCDADMFEAEIISTDLIKANLSNANLHDSDLFSANLGGANLSDADFTDASLAKADLRNTYIGGANLSGANISGADLSGSQLNGTNLFGANLSHANLSRVTLKGANVNRAIADSTVFVDIDLRQVKGLESIEHYGPSEISISTIYRSQGQLPEVFLSGCGLRDWEIEAIKLYRTDLTRNQIVELTYKVIELRTNPLIQFNSCFISYSSEDEKFAKRLYSDLQEWGVRCWFAPEHMKIGDRTRRRIDDSIRLHDKLLLVLSKTSVASQWIEQEVATALEKEREQGCEVLFPIRLDNTVMNLRSDWPALIKNTRHIGNFSGWANPSDYEKAFTRLLNDLRMDA